MTIIIFPTIPYCYQSSLPSGSPPLPPLLLVLGCVRPYPSESTIIDFRLDHMCQEGNFIDPETSDVGYAGAHYNIAAIIDSIVEFDDNGNAADGFTYITRIRAGQSSASGK